MLLMLITSLLLSVPQAGQSSIDEWDIGENANGCYAAQAYVGDDSSTYLSVGKTLDGHALMIIQNYGWSTEKDKKYLTYVIIDDLMFEINAIGGARGALVFNIGPDLLGLIARGKKLIAALKVDDKSEKLLEAFKLTGSAKAVDGVNVCLDELSKKKRRAEVFKPDPFKP